jgi:hypothetical protein
MTREHRTPLSNWGGRRHGAGRKRKLERSDRREIAGDYFARMQEAREFGDTLRRDALIRKLMAKYKKNKVTHRMIVRCVAEFLPDIRRNAKMYNQAIEGAEIQPLPARNLNKLKPGIYANKQLRLVNSDGTRKWICRFISGFTVRDMVLGGSKISLATALKRATNASQMVRRGQNPIDALGSAKCDLDFGIKLLARGGNVRRLASHLPQLRTMVRCRNPKYLSRSRIASRNSAS